MPQLGQGRNMYRGGGASPARSIDLGAPSRDLGADFAARAAALRSGMQSPGGLPYGDARLPPSGGLQALVPGWKGPMRGGGSRDTQLGMPYSGPGGTMPGGVRPGYTGDPDPTGGRLIDDVSSRPMPADTFDPGGRSAATLQKQWSDLDPTAQQGYIKQYQAASPAMQKSVLGAMGIPTGRPSGWGTPDAGPGVGSVRSSDYGTGYETGRIGPETPGLSSTRSSDPSGISSSRLSSYGSGPMGPGAQADFTRKAQGAQGGGLGADFGMPGGGTSAPGGGMRPAVQPRTPGLGGGIGGLSGLPGLAARPRPGPRIATQDYFG